MTRIVPAAPKRDANLLSTRYEEHALTPFGVAWYVALAAALAPYAYANVERLVPNGQAMGRMIGIGIIVILSALSYCRSQRQPAQPGQQKFGVAVMIFCLLVVLGRIAQNFFGAAQVKESWFFFFFALAMQFVYAVKAVRQARAAGSRCAPAS